MVAVAVAGVLAAIVAVILSITSPLVNPTTGLNETLIVLIGVVAGGIDRLTSATLGGFAIGFATSFVGSELPTSGTTPFTSNVYMPSVIYLAVIVALLLRPQGSSRGPGKARWSGYEARRLADRAARADRPRRPPGGRLQPVGDERRPGQVPERDRLRRARHRAVRLRRQLRRDLLRPGQLRRRRRLRERRDDHPARLEARRAADAVPAPARPLDLERVVARPRRRARGGLCVRRRHPAHAPVRHRRRHLDARRAGHHLQHPHVLDEHRAGFDGAVPDPDDDGLLAGDRRRGRGHLRGVRLPAQPFRPPAACCQGGPGGRARRRDRHPPPAPARLHAVGRALRFRRRTLRPPAREHRHQPGLPRPHLPHPGDARRRRASRACSAP